MGAMQICASAPAPAALLLKSARGSTTLPRMSEATPGRWKATLRPSTTQPRSRSASRVG